MLNIFYTFSCFTKLSHSIRVRQDTKNEDLTDFRSYFPDFLWLLRDVTLETTGRDGQTVSPTEYLKTKVLCRRSTTLMPEAADLVSMAIMNYFPSVECMTLPPPSSDAEVMRDIVNNEQHLSKQFNKGVADVVAFVCQRVKAKHAFKAGCSVDGPTLAALTEQYAEAINTRGSIPCLDNTWNTVVKLRVKTTMDELAEEYEKVMEAATKGKLPMEEDSVSADATSTNYRAGITFGNVHPKLVTLFGLHRSALKARIDTLLTQIASLLPPEGQHDTSVLKKKELVEDFEKRIVEYTGKKVSDHDGTIAFTAKVVTGGIFLKFIQQNYSLSHKQCTQLFQDLYQPIENRIQRALSQTTETNYTFNDLQKDISDLDKKYLARAIGPAKWEVYNEKQQQLASTNEGFKHVEGFKADALEASRKEREAVAIVKASEERLQNLQKQMKEEKATHLEQLQKIQTDHSNAIERVHVEGQKQLERELQKQNELLEAKMKSAAEAAALNYEKLKAENEFKCKELQRDIASAEEAAKKQQESFDEEVKRIEAAKKSEANVGKLVQ